MSGSSFVHLHLHTQFSLLDGAIRAKPLMQRVREMGMGAVAQTDHGNLFGAISFYGAAREAGLKPIVGMEAYVAPGSRFEKGGNGAAGGGGAEPYRHLTLLAMDGSGYRNLCKLSSAGYLEGFYRKPRIDLALLGEHHEGLIAASGCIVGEIPQLVLAEQDEKAREAAERYLGIFGDRFYLELMDNGLESQKRANEGVARLARTMGIGLVATNDCHYLDRDDAEAHDLLLCIQTGRLETEEKRLRFLPYLYHVRTPEEMETIFSAWPDAIENTARIAERCNLDLDLGDFQLPHFRTPDGQEVEGFFASEARRGLDGRLATLRGAQGLDPAEARRAYGERLEHEIGVILRMGFAGYFLIAADFLAFARRSGIPVGPGRGSAAGSLVAYALGITDLDPIRHGLLFERFLNPERVSLPDIDMDFCERRRDEVLRYVAEKYGKENVAQIITFGSMKARAVVKNVGRSLGLSFGEQDAISKMIPNELKMTIDRALAQNGDLKKRYSTDERVHRLIDLARRLEGLASHASTHAAGLVIGNRPLVEVVPLFKDAKDAVLTQYTMTDVEKVGLVKFDFLGLSTLTILADAVRLVRDNRRVEVDPASLDMSDRPTYELLAAGDTNGIFQLESTGIRDVLVRLKPTRFEELVALNALYRPGPLESGMHEEFIRRRHGRVAVTYEHPDMEPILRETYGVMVYQEQVMRIAQTLGGFSPGQADELRQAMSKKKVEKMPALRERFLQGARSRRIAARTAQKIWDQMEKFGGYGFNKSHSAAYALIAFQTAYMKAHYPVEFMAAVLTNEAGNADKLVRYVAECREKEIQVAPPDIQESDSSFAVRGEVIRFGLAAVKNVGATAIESILDARRKQGRFRDLLGFLEAVDLRKVNRRVVESLVKCGAFDSLGLKRAAVMQVLDEALEIAGRAQRDRERGQISMFGGEGNGQGLDVRIRWPDVAEWPREEKLRMEKEVLGFYISDHPLRSHERALAMCATATTDRLGEIASGSEVVVAGMVSARREKISKKGGKMAFLTFEDLRGRVEIVVFPKVYETSHALWTGERPIVVRARVESPEAAGRGAKGERAIQTKLIALEVSHLDTARVVGARKIHIRVDEGAEESSILPLLRDILKDHRGSCPTVLHLLDRTGSETVVALSESFAVEPTETFLGALRRLCGPNAVSVSR